MTIAVSKILGDASRILKDEGVTRRWSTDELLDWLNMAQKQIVLLKPDAYIVTKVMQLSVGTRQSLPDGSSNFQDPSEADLPAGILLIDISRNMGSSRRWHHHSTLTWLKPSSSVSAVRYGSSIMSANPSSAAAMWPIGLRV